jgi:hypothetical protein
MLLNPRARRVGDSHEGRQQQQQRRRVVH